MVKQGNTRRFDFSSSPQQAPVQSFPGKDNVLGASTTVPTANQALANARREREARTATQKAPVQAQQAPAQPVTVQGGASKKPQNAEELRAARRQYFEKPAAQQVQASRPATVQQSAVPQAPKLPATPVKVTAAKPRSLSNKEQAEKLGITPGIVKDRIKYFEGLNKQPPAKPILSDREQAEKLGIKPGIVKKQVEHFNQLKSAPVAKPQSSPVVAKRSELQSPQVQASRTQSLQAAQPKVQAKTTAKPATVAATSSSVEALAKKAVTESQQARSPATELSQQPAYQFYHVMLVVFPVFIVDLRMLVLPQPIQIYPLFTLQHCIATGEVLLGHWSAFTHGYSAPATTATNITINNNVVVGNNNQVVQQTDQRSSFHFGANPLAIEPAQRQQQEQTAGGPKPTNSR